MNMWNTNLVEPTWVKKTNPYWVMTPNIVNHLSILISIRCGTKSYSMPFSKPNSTQVIDARQLPYSMHDPLPWKYQQQSLYLHSSFSFSPPESYRPQAIQPCCQSLGRIASTRRTSFGTMRMWVRVGLSVGTFSMVRWYTLLLMIDRSLEQVGRWNTYMWHILHFHRYLFT